MTSRKVYRLLPKAGSISNLKMVEEEVVKPNEHEVLVRVKSIGLNFADIFAMFGLYSATPSGSFIPGLEFSGEVVSCGAAVEDFKQGDRVMGVTRFGGYANHVTINSRYLTPMPDGWNYEHGAAYLVQALTAYYALVNLANLQTGNTVLIHSAAGGVGLLANRIAKAMGATTIGTVGNDSKLQLMKDEGYMAGIVRGKDFKHQLKKALDDRELNVVLECVGGKYFTESYKAMTKQGRMVVYGSARYATPGSKPDFLHLIWKYLTRARLDPQKMIEENKAVLGFNLIWLFEKADLMDEVLGGLAKLDIGKPYVGHTFGFDQMHDAIRLFQSGKTMGKVVVRA